MEEEAENNEEGNRDRETPQGEPVKVICVGWDVPPPEGNTEFPGFTPDRAHLLLQDVYGDFPHHTDGLHLDGVIADNAIWQRRWHWLDTKSAIWYAMPSGAVRCRFTAILAAEWRWILGRS